jgi:hypothetical protein
MEIGKQVAMLPMGPKASAQWLAGPELSRKLDCLRTLPTWACLSAKRFCVKFSRATGNPHKAKTPRLLASSFCNLA